jgi:hypothetical protein
MKTIEKESKYEKEVKIDGVRYYFKILFGTFASCFTLKSLLNIVRALYHFLYCLDFFISKNVYLQFLSMAVHFKPAVPALVA